MKQYIRNFFQIKEFMKILYKSSSSGSLISFADAEAATQIFFK